MDGRAGQGDFDVSGTGGTGTEEDVMARLTQKDDQGNWCLRGVKWAQLHVGQTITQEVSEKLYGALWKLMEYEDTGLTPDQITDLLEY